MSSVTAILDWTAPGTLEVQSTRPLYQRMINELSWESDNFDPTMFEEGDSPILMELGERLRRSGLKIKVEAHMYKLRLEVIVDRAAEAAEQIAGWLTLIVDLVADSFCLCGAFSDVAIKSARVA